MTDFKIPDEALKTALSAIVLEGEDVYHHIIFGLNDDSEDMRKTMTEEIVRAALEAALPVMFEPIRIGHAGRLTLYRLKEPK